MKLTQLIRSLTSSAALLMATSTVHGQVVIGNSGFTTSNIRGNEFTLANFNASGADKLVVTVSSEGPQVVDNITFGGVLLTEAVFQNDLITTNGIQNSAIYYLDSPDGGVPAAGIDDIVVTWTNIPVGANNRTDVSGSGIGAYALLGTVDGPPESTESVTPAAEPSATPEEGREITVTTTVDGSLVIVSYVQDVGVLPEVTPNPPYTLLFAGDVGSAVGASASAIVPTAGPSTATFDGMGRRPVTVAAVFAPGPLNAGATAQIVPIGSSLFGDLDGQPSGSEPITRSFVIRNGGDADLSVSELLLGGVDAASFAIDLPALPTLASPMVISPGEVVSIPVIFDNDRGGEIGGTFNAMIEITSDDPNSPSVVTLDSFMITDPELIIVDNPFGAIILEEAPVTLVREVSVSNEGTNNDLEFNVSTTGLNGGSFVATPSNLIVPPGENGLIQVTLTLGGETNFEAALEITHNDPDLTSPLPVPLDTEILVDPPLFIIFVTGFPEETDTMDELASLIPGATISVGDFALMTLEDNEAELALLNLAELIIFDRRTASANFSGSDQVDFWDSVEAPIIQTNPGIAESDGWQMIGGQSTTDVPLAGAEAQVTAEGATGLSLAVAGPQAQDFLNDRDGDPPAHVDSIDLGLGGILWAYANLPDDLDDPEGPGSEAAQIAFWPSGSENSGGTIYPADRYYFGVSGDGVANSLLVDPAPAGRIALITLIGDILGVTIDIPEPVDPVDLVVTDIARNADGTVTLTWDSEAAATYAIRYSADLSGAVLTWDIDSTGIASGGATTTATTAMSFSSDPRLFLAIERE